MIESTKTDLEKKEIETTYKNLKYVEHAFFEMKNIFEIRPVFHQKKERIKGHIFTCFMSYVLLHEFQEVMRKELQGGKHTLDELLTELRSIYKVPVRIGKIVIDKISELTELQRTLLNRFKISTV